MGVPDTTLTHDDAFDDEPIRYMQRTRDWYLALGYGNPYRWAHFTDVPFGLKLGAETTLRGRLAFEPDDKELFAVIFALDDSSIAYSIGSSIKDHKEFCWRIEYPCAGTWTDPIRKYEGRDCKILWQYEIPIGITDNVRISGTKVRLPVRLNLPTHFEVTTKIADAEFRRTLDVAVKPLSFVADDRGLFMKALVDVKQQTL